MTKHCCQCCGKEVDWPPFDYTNDAPWKRFVEDESDCESKVYLTRDECVIDDRVFMIRGNIDIPVLDAEDKFVCGAWCSVSKESYERISAAWNEQRDEGEPPAFAWLLSALPCYPVPAAPVKARLHLRKPGIAPLIEVDPDHPLGQEQLTGINMDRVMEFARQILGPDAGPRCCGG